MDADADKAPAWVEQVDPSSGGTFWKNSVTGEISLEDPSNRAKSMLTNNTHLIKLQKQLL